MAGARICGSKVAPKWPANKKSWTASATGAYGKGVVLLLAAAGVLDGVRALDFTVNLVHPNDLSVERPGNKRRLFDLAGLGFGNGYAIHFQRAAKRALVVRF